MEIFKYNTLEVRTQVAEDGEVWFLANDIALALELGNPRQALESHVDADDVQKLDIIDNMGRNQVANFVNESGLYALIFGSQKQEAKAFKRWVTSEVLPAIRKKGGYIAKGVTQAQFDTLFSELVSARRENKALEDSNQYLRTKTETLDLEIRQKCAENFALALSLEELPMSQAFDDCGNYPNESIYSDSFMALVKRQGTERDMKHVLKLGKQLDTALKVNARLAHRYNELNAKYRKLI